MTRAGDASTASGKGRNRLGLALRIAAARALWAFWPASAPIGTPRGPVALIRWDGKIGDWVISSFLFAAIRDGLGVETVAIAAPHQLDLYRTTPGVDVVLPCRRKSLGDVVRTGLALRRLRVDTVVELTDRARWSDLIVMALSGARLRIKGCEPKIGSLFRLVDLPEDGHMIERNLAFLAAIGVGPRDWRFDWALPEEDRAAARAAFGTGAGPAIVLNPFGADRRRVLPAETVAAIARRLAEAAAAPPRIVVPLPPGAPADWRLDPPLRPAGTVVLPVRRIEETAACVAAADLVISPDTSVVHVAALFDKPLVALYPETSRETRRWAPRSTRATLLVPSETEDPGGDVGIRAVSVDRIVAAALDRLVAIPSR